MDCDVTLSAPEWTRLRNIRERIRRESEKEDENEMTLLHEQSELDRKQRAEREDLFSRLLRVKAKRIRLKKQLRLASGRVDAAVAAEIEALETEDVEEEATAPPSPLPLVESSVEMSSGSSLWEMPPLDWSAISDASFPWELPEMVSTGVDNSSDS
jgi:hypothetical protein